ncbi:MAG: response regulator [Mariprofundus sp.]|nr:response regulator [Mariprofundus sp.]
MTLSLPVKFALFSSLITLFGVLGVALMAYVESDRLLQREAVDNLFESMGTELTNIEKQAKLVKDDVQFLAHSDAVRAFANRLDTPSVHTAPMLVKHIEQIFSTVLSRREMYYQVRLIGIEHGGREVVRVARLQQGLVVIADDLLQQKGSRDYYLNSVQLKAGEVLFSDITLNREYGEITQPPQPMLRVSTAIYSDSGQLRGILLINADFNVFTAMLQKKQDDQSFFIANEQGDYLIHADPAKAMAFEYQRQSRFQRDFLLNAETLISSFENQDRKIDEYLFDQRGEVLLLGNIHLDQEKRDHILKVGAVVTLKQLRQQSIEFRNRMLLLTLFLSVVLGFITYFIARYFTRPINEMIDAAVEIGNGNHHVQIPAKTHDEIGVLGAALQQMLVHLDETRRKTEALNAALEVKVNKRTAELARLAGALEAQNSELENAVLKAEHATLAKGQFLATMSHEIRTPLNGILGLTELVLASKMHPAQRARIEIVQSSGQALLTILNDILDFSKIEAGHMEMKRVDFNPNEMIEHVANLFARQINEDEAKLELIARAIPLLPRLLIGDSDRLHQVMLNLLSNAAKFTEQGEIVISVDLLSESATEARVRFQVADTGRGISAKDQQHLFEEFTQADGTDTRKHGGTGLGLAIVKRLVGLMGGEISVVSETGKGSRFFFDLDLEKSTEIVDGPHHYTAEFAQWRALVVDDNASNQRMLHDVLVAWNMHCDTSNDGNAALQQLQAMAAKGEHYDVVFIDQQMQGMDGMALARLIKAEAHLADVKVIMITSLDMTFDQDLREEYGLDGFMRKPVYVHSLFETSLDVLGARQRKTRHVNIISTEQRHERILLAEDNMVNQQVAVGLLQNQGFVHIDVANNGAEALMCFAEQPYDLVLMDIQMPELDGIAATREIRELELLSDHQPIPIIALTAHTMPEDIQRTHDAGMNDHLAKPLTGKTLASMLAIWLRLDDGNTNNGHEAGNDAQPNKAELDESNEDAVVDADVLRQLRSDMGFGVGMILDTYMDELPKQVDGLIAAIEAGNADELRRHGHRLKGSSRSVAANALGEICFQFEQLGQSGQQQDMTTAKLLIADLRQQATQVIDALSDESLNDIR